MEDDPIYLTRKPDGRLYTDSGDRSWLLGSGGTGGSSSINLDIFRPPDRHSWVSFAEQFREATNRPAIVLPPQEPEPANIPPDELVPDPDACQDCGMSDGPLYQGRRCRWCWKLVSLRADTDREETAEAESELAIQLNLTGPAVILALLSILFVLMILGMAYN